MCWHQVRKCDLKGALDHRGYKGTAEEVMMDITLLLTCRRCYDHCIWTLFSSFSSCFLLTHIPCSWLGLPFCDSCALTQTVLSWLILGHLSQALEAVWWLMDLIHDSPLFVLVYYKLWLFNYKYHVVAVVRPQSCLCPLLAIQVIPLSTSVSLELLHSPLNHRTLASTATPLMSSIPRPCKVLTEEDIRLRVLFPSSAGYNNLTKLLPKEETQLGDCTVTNEQNTKNNTKMRWDPSTYS